MYLHLEAGNLLFYFPEVMTELMQLLICGLGVPLLKTQKLLKALQIEHTETFVIIW